MKIKVKKFLVYALQGIVYTAGLLLVTPSFVQVLLEYNVGVFVTAFIVYAVIMSLFIVALNTGIERIFLGKKSVVVKEIVVEAPLVATVSDHGSRLEEVMENIRTEVFEYDAIFDLEGNKLAEGTYSSPFRCNIRSEDWAAIRKRREAAIRVHNHPGRSNGAFSSQDFKAFLSEELIKKSIVVTEKYNYILEKVHDMDYSLLQDVAKAYSTKVQQKYAWIYGLSPRIWSVVAAHKTAKHFDLRFRIEHLRPSRTRKTVISFGAMACAAATVVLCFISYQAFATNQSTPVEKCLPTMETISVADLANECIHGTVGGSDFESTNHGHQEACDPINDSYIQGNAPIGGGPNA